MLVFTYAFANMFMEIQEINIVKWLLASSFIFMDMILLIFFTLYRFLVHINFYPTLSKKDSFVQRSEDKPRLAILCSTDSVLWSLSNVACNKHMLITVWYLWTPWEILPLIFFQTKIIHCIVVPLQHWRSIENAPPRSS